MVFKSQLRKMFPFQSHYLTVAGYRLHYIDEGPTQGGDSAKVVLLLHGNPTWSFYYRHVIAALRSDFRVIAPDYIGCGLSDHPTDQHYRAADRIEHMQEFVRLLGLKRYSIVMHDWGGSIGTGLAVRNLAAVDRLVYLNTTLTETEVLPGIIKTAAHPLIGKFLTKTTRRFLHLTTTVGVGRKLPKAVRKAYYFPYRSRQRRTAIWDFVADIPFESSHPTYGSMMELAEKLPELRNVPVQLIWGLRDPCFHREMLAKLAEQLPHARVLEIPEASHLVLEDAPDLACSTIRSFLLGGDPENEKPIPRVRQNALYAAFNATAENTPTMFAVITPLFVGDSIKYEQITYRSLQARVFKYERGLAQLGLRRGDRVLMLVSPGTDFLALSYAVMGRGGIPFYLDPGMGRKKLLRCIADIAPDAFIGSPLAHLLGILNRRLFTGCKFTITAGPIGLFGSKSTSSLRKFAARELPTVASDGVCLTAFTSGATGVPKGVVFTDDMIRAQLEIFKDSFGIQAGKRDLPLLPIFSLYTVASGVCSVFPPLNPARPLELKPDRIIRLIQDLGISYSFGSPTLWKKISEYCVRSHSTLPSIEKVFMAGAPVGRETLERVRTMLPQGEVYTPYGATEALPVTLITGEDLLSAEPILALDGEQGTLVGSPLSAVDVKIIKPVDGAIASIDQVVELQEREIGEVIVKGNNVSSTYFDRAEATELSKIREGSVVWHRMGDLGYLDAKGRLYFCGRKVHAVKTSQRTYYSVPTEFVFNQSDKVARSALIASGLDGEPAIVVEPDPTHWPETNQDREQFISELRELAQSSPVTAAINCFYFHRCFPVDGRHNAKIFRDQLQTWANDEGGRPGG